MPLAAAAWRRSSRRFHVCAAVLGGAHATSLAQRGRLCTAATRAAAVTAALAALLPQSPCRRRRRRRPACSPQLAGLMAAACGCLPGGARCAAPSGRAAAAGGDSCPLARPCHGGGLLCRCRLRLPHGRRSPRSTLGRAAAIGCDERLPARPGHGGGGCRLRRSRRQRSPRCLPWPCCCLRPQRSPPCSLRPRGGALAPLLLAAALLAALAVPRPSAVLLPLSAAARACLLALATAGVPAPLPLAAAA